MDMCCVNEESERVLNESADILEQAITAGRLPRLQRLQVKILEMGSMELLEDEDEEANEIFDSLKDTCREWKISWLKLMEGSIGERKYLVLIPTMTAVYVRIDLVFTSEGSFLYYIHGHYSF